MYYLKQAAQMMDDSSIQADIYYKIGNVYSWAGSPSQAFIYYDSSIQLAANNASAQNRVIETAIKTYHNQAAMASLEYLYQHQQIDWNKQLLLGYLYSYSSRFEEAKNMENQLLSFYPYYLAPLDELGATLNLLSGNYKLSKDYFQSLQAHLPKDSMVLYNLARLSEKSGNHQEAIKYIRLALLNGFRYPYVLELDPFFNKLRFTKGWKDLMKTYAIPPISY
jgi:Flp pilus assembly protein TadD